MKRATIINIAISCVLSGVVVRHCSQGQSLPPAPSGVEITREYGWEFATIAVSGNAPFQPVGTPGNPLIPGRGSVAAPFRIARTEVTTGQWMQFLNTFAQQPDPPERIRTIVGFGFYTGPIYWGGVRQGPLGPGASYQLADVPNAASFYVGGISWRMAALYCNWLNNNQSSDWSSLLTGAYDTSTWGLDPTTFAYTDAASHLPNARFWLPSLDQWLAAGFYDPNRHGPQQGGWWSFANSSDSAAVPGPPGAGTTPSGWSGGDDAWFMPVASYATAQSPWGLFDITGGASEWTEEVLRPEGPGTARWLGGSWSTNISFSGDSSIYFVTTGSPTLGDTSGFRIAAAVPCPATVGLAWLSMFAATQRRRAST